MEDDEKEVVEDESGNRSLKLDLECGVPFARTATDEQSTRNRIFEGGYHSGGNGTVFMLRAKVPANHIHLIDHIMSHLFHHIIHLSKTPLRQTMNSHPNIITINLVDWLAYFHPPTCKP